MLTYGRTDVESARSTASSDVTKECGTISPSEGENQVNRERPSRFRLSAKLVSDATIGLSDGLTVPFALTAGLSSLGDKNVVIFGGLAELAAGAVSMGMAGWLGARSER